MPVLLGLGPLPALVAALIVPDGTSLVLPQLLLGLTLTLDKVGAMLLGTASLLWIAAGIYLRADLRAIAGAGAFVVWWLLTLIGSLGVFLAADMVGFYLFFTLVSLPAYGLIVHDTSARARHAGSVYIALALAGEALLLVGFVLLAAAMPHSGVLIRDAVAALSTSPWRDAALAFLISGFALKIGLVPLHVWMPLAYSAAPIAAACVLSGAAVKAGVIGLIRFLPFESALPGWGAALATAGMLSAFYGAAVGTMQSHPKTVLAYSSVSQMGVLAAALGMGLVTHNQHTQIAAAYYAMHHMLVKGALFLAVGVAAASMPRRWLLWLPAAVLALGLAGLPLTGGALAKSAIKPLLGNGTVAWLADLSAMASALLMFHFLRCLLLSGPQDRETSMERERSLAWLMLALASVLVPYALLASLDVASWQNELATKAIWDGLWPILAGGLLAIVHRQWGDRLPRMRVQCAGSQPGRTAYQPPCGRRSHLDRPISEPMASSQDDVCWAAAGLSGRIAVGPIR